MVKTAGWQVNLAVFGEFRNAADNWGSTTDGRLYWAERNDIDLAGFQIRDKTLSPRQMIVQESYAPVTYGMRTYGNVDKSGQAPNIEIHDIFSTMRLSDNTIDLMVGSATNANTDTNNYFGLPVSMRPTEGIGATDQTNRTGAGVVGGLLDSDYRDTEQIVACRSRRYEIDMGGMRDVDFDNMNAQVRRIPMRISFDSQWGSGDQIASDYLYHVRIMISTIDRTNGFNELPEVANNSWFVAIPPSIQYLTTDVQSPDFITQMTQTRRSRSI
jgi:hypothetical protein